MCIGIAWSITRKGGDYKFWDMDMTSFPEYKLLMTQEITISVPKVDGREVLVECLRDQKKAIIEKATSDAQRLDEKIEELLALTYEPA